MAKSMLTSAITLTTPASGVVIINSGTAGAPDGKVESRGVLAKSIQSAMTDGRITVELGTKTLLRLDSQPVDQVWNALTQTTRDSIFNTAK